ncbi:hypothetical protein B296_00025127 [Ensete ventricosum]|uniref:Vps41 C-terminal RING finger domain-containing protein n=1 Tax=Ensete ventricosum TaxID=4639 RepID=A0A426ZYR0_ENSVE|nr:hypothetical protein B296_00025127 [Ensete ventricosum]
MILDSKRAVHVLILHRDFIPPSEVVGQLLGASKKCDEKSLLHLYLHSLFEIDPQAGKEFHDLQAVEFVTMQHDDDLWEELIKQCLRKPEMNLSVVVFFCCHAYHIACLIGASDSMNEASNASDSDDDSENDDAQSRRSRMCCVLCTTAGR